MSHEMNMEELEEIARLEFNNQAMGLIAEQCRAMKKDCEAEILGGYIRVNEARLAHLMHKDDNKYNNSAWLHVEPRPTRRWGLFDRMERLLHG